MARKKNFTSPPEMPSYRQDIHKPINQLLIITPLLVLFQVGSARLGSGLLVPQYMRLALECLGAPGRWLPMFSIIAVLVAQHFLRKDPLRINGLAVGGILVESLWWTLPLVAVGWIASIAPAGAWQLAAGQNNDGAWLRVALEAIGAGVYEEFLFRMVFISVVTMLLLDLLRWNKDAVIATAVVLGGVIFAAFHFSPAQLTGQSPLPWGSLIFLSIAGMWWGVLFLWRGLAVAVCSHIWWNLFVIAWGQ
jgi:hypothetical protein